mmetsp:Transcript_15431/g.64060  ORF Transcript_15431/g.64060 Transcript_15431/m.64060 type:complete len:427 (-) Transcript_15431:1815-3095(-)
MQPRHIGAHRTRMQRRGFLLLLARHAHRDLGRTAWRAAGLCARHVGIEPRDNDGLDQLGVASILVGLAGARWRLSVPEPIRRRGLLLPALAAAPFPPPSSPRSSPSRPEHQPRVLEQHAELPPCLRDALHGSQAHEVVARELARGRPPAPEPRLLPRVVPAQAREQVALLATVDALAYGVSLVALVERRDERRARAHGGGDRQDGLDATHERAVHEHLSDARVHGEQRQVAAQRRHGLVGRRQRAKRRELRNGCVDGVRLRRVNAATQKDPRVDATALLKLHGERERVERHAQDLGRLVLREERVVAVPREEADAPAWPHAPRAPAALPRTRTRHPARKQRVHARCRIEARLLDLAAVDDDGTVVDGDTRLSDVGSEGHLTCALRRVLEHPLLLLRAELRVQRDEVLAATRRAVDGSVGRAGLVQR